MKVEPAYVKVVTKRDGTPPKTKSKWTESVKVHYADWDDTAPKYDKSKFKLQTKGVFNVKKLKEKNIVVTMLYEIWSGPDRDYYFEL